MPGHTHPAKSGTLGLGGASEAFHRLHSSKSGSDKLASADHLKRMICSASDVSILIASCLPSNVLHASKFGPILSSRAFSLRADLPRIVVESWSKASAWSSGACKSGRRLRTLTLALRAAFFWSLSIASRSSLCSISAVTKYGP